MADWEHELYDLFNDIVEMIANHPLSGDHTMVPHRWTREYWVSMKEIPIELALGSRTGRWSRRWYEDRIQESLDALDGLMRTGRREFDDA